jgi:hypothetical protein
MTTSLEKRPSWTKSDTAIQPLVLCWEVIGHAKAAEDVGLSPRQRREVRV